MSRVIFILAFVAALAFLQCRVTAAPATNEGGKIFLVQDPTDKKFVAIIKFKDEESEDNKCRIFTDSVVIEGIKKITSDDNILRPSVDEMKNMREICEASLKGKKWDGENQVVENKNALLEGEQGKEEARGWDIIFPGTKWCGTGNISKNNEDFGEQEDTDRCCRDHDMCDDLMESGETKHNITNNSLFTSLSCNCDNALYDCLSRINSYTSNAVGRMYFTLLRRQCFVEDYLPKCKTYWTRLEMSCREYEKDTSKPKVYQWVSAKFYGK